MAEQGAETLVAWLADGDTPTAEAVTEAPVCLGDRYQMDRCPPLEPLQRRDRWAELRAQVAARATTVREALQV